MASTPLYRGSGGQNEPSTVARTVQSSAHAAPFAAGALRPGGQKGVSFGDPLAIPCARTAARGWKRAADDEAQHVRLIQRANHLHAAGGQRGYRLDTPRGGPLSGPGGSRSMPSRRQFLPPGRMASALSYCGSGGRNEGVSAGTARSSRPI